MPDFSRRASTPELMDTETVGFEDFQCCLAELARVNQLTLAYRPTLAFLDGLAERGHLPRDRALSILDVGSGYGDMLRQIDLWAARRGIPVCLTGIDLNPWSARAAAEATSPGRPIRWVTADLFEYEPEGRVDLVLSSLFAHHLDDRALVRFVAWMEAKGRLGWFVNDLHRHPLPYHVFATATRIARRHRFIRHDGPVSISRAFDKADWRRILDAAGVPVTAAGIAWWLPFRICVSRVKAS